MTNPGDALSAFSEVRLVHHSAVADLFSARSADGRPAVLVALTPEAGADQAWRAAFADLLARDRAAVNPADQQYVVPHTGDLNGPRPWIASYFVPGRRGIERLLTVIPNGLPPGTDPTAMVGAAVSSYAPPTPGPLLFGSEQDASAPASGAPESPYGSGPAAPGGPSSPFGLGPASDQAAPSSEAAAPPPEQQQSRYAALAEPWDAQRPKPTPWVNSDPPPDPTAAAPAAAEQQWSIPTDQPATPVSSPRNSGYSTPDGASAPSYGGGRPASGYGAPAADRGFGGDSSVSGPGYGGSAPASGSGYGGSPSLSGPGYGANAAASFGSEPAYGSGGATGYAGESSGSEYPGYPGTPEHSHGNEDTHQRTGRGRAGMIIGMITVVTVLVMVAAGFAVVLLKKNDKKDTASVSPSHTSSPLPADTAGPTPTPSRSPLPSTTPSLRADVKEVSVLGPTWARSEKTEPLNLPGWPFSFRLPDGWSCLRGTVENLPDADGWGCVKTSTDGGNHHQRFNVMLRRCPTSCTADEQSDMDDAWFDNDEKPRIKRFDKTTTYAETTKNKDGFYTVDSSHYCADKPNGNLTYEVGIFFQTPPQYKAEMQKSLNDVISQSPAAA